MGRVQRVLHLTVSTIVQRLQTACNGRRLKFKSKIVRCNLQIGAPDLFVFDVAYKASTPSDGVLGGTVNSNCVRTSVAVDFANTEDYLPRMKKGVDEKSHQRPQIRTVRFELATS